MRNAIEMLIEEMYEKEIGRRMNNSDTTDYIEWLEKELKSAKSEIERLDKIIDGYERWL